MIGEDRAEMLDYIPAQIRVKLTRRPRYGCLACEGAVHHNRPVLVRPRPGSSTGRVVSSGGEGHMRRPFYDFYVSTKSPLAAEVSARISAPHAIEADIRGRLAEHREQVRRARSRPIIETLHVWLQDHIGHVSAISDLARAIRYALHHRPGLIVDPLRGSTLDDGRVEMDTNVVERAIRPHTLTRKNALFHFRAPMAVPGPGRS